MKKEFEFDTDKIWNSKLGELFNSNVPSHCEWTNQNSILNILNKIGTTRDLNHTFFPHGGGLDLSSCKASIESGCIELNFQGSIEIAKVTKLVFNSLDSTNHKSSYFRIETETLEPSGVYEDYGIKNYEALTELNPGEYVDIAAWDSGYWGEDERGNSLKIPGHSRRIRRTFNGTYVLFSKSSYYNQISGTYDGEHNKMNDVQFREFVNEISNGFQK